MSADSGGVIKVRVKDPVKAYKRRYRTGTFKKKPMESRKEFVDRVQRDFPEIILGVRANFDSAALVFGVGSEELAVFTNTSKACKDAYTRARAIEAAEKHEGKEAAKKLREKAESDLESKDKRFTRKTWPRNPDIRYKTIHDALMISIIENHGDMMEVSKCLRLGLPEIYGVMDGDSALMEQKERGMKLAVWECEAALSVQARAGNVTALKTMLENLASDDWSSKSTVNVNHVGFAPPDEKEAGESVLSLIKGKKEEDEADSG